MNELRPAAPSDRALGFLWLGAVAALILASPLAPALAAGLWGCPFKSLVGLPCPFCGTTRAALALARLDVLGAFVRHPLPALGWTLFLAGGLLAGGLALRGRSLPRVRWVPLGARVAIVAALLLNWAYSILTGV